MKKTYIIPVIRLHAVQTSNIIVTSDNIPIGDDQGEVSTDAPRRSDDWSDYNR
ncbi:MAG: hypothetical protein IKH58_00355 [Bacteroidales bacterium]|jgi:hypothetical protein|nr:hypothetical protein [Bacteroidales bacterium]